MVLVARMLDHLHRSCPVIVALLFVTLFASVSCQQDILEVDGKSNVIRRRLSEDPRTIDPHMSGDTISGAMCGLAYEQLFEYDYFKRPVELTPCLASAMPVVSEDRLTYTFALRKDVLFQDNPCFPGGKGRKMTAHDVEYSIKRVASMPDSNGWWVFQGRIRGLDDWRDGVINVTANVESEEVKRQLRQKEFDKKVAGIAIVDDYTINIQLTTPYPQFLFAITLSYGAVVPQEAVDYYGKMFFANPVGTGPFKLEAWRERHELVWIRNKNYRDVTYPIPPEIMPKDEGFAKREAYLVNAGKRLPLADRAIHTIIKEDQSTWLQFLAGNIDFIEPTKDQFTSAIQGGTLSPAMVEKHIVLNTYDDPTIEYLSFNMKDPVVGTAAGERGRALRKAISLAFDRDFFIKHYQNGRGVPATLLLPKDVMAVLGYHGDYALPYVRYDPKAARDSLKEGGYSVTQDDQGKWNTADPATGQRVHIKVLLRDPALKDFARFLSYTGDEIGITLEGEILTFAEFLRQQDEGRGQVYHAGWVMDYPDAQNMLLLLYGPLGNGNVNSSNYASPVFDELYVKMEALDQSIPEQRREKLDLVLRMHAEIAKDCPWVPIRFRRQFEMYHHWCSPRAPNVFNYNHYKYASSVSQVRTMSAKQWRKTPAAPAIIMIAFFGVVSLLFIYKVIRQP